MGNPTARLFRGEEDFGALIDLLRAIAADDSSFTLIPDDYHYEWVDEEPGWINSRTIWEHDGSIVAMTGIWFEPAGPHDRAYSELEIHPDWRSESYWDETVRHMDRATAELVDRAADLRLGVRKPRTDKRDALIRAGFVHDRVFNRLAV